MPERPWCDDEVRRAALEDPYAEFKAWETWMVANLDDLIPDEEHEVLNALTFMQRSYLFNLMIRLADGNFSRSEAI